MTNGDVWLRDLRKTLGLTQSEMAGQMGLSLRPYQKLESKERRIGRRHIRLAESVALEVAIEKEDPELAPEPVRDKVIKLAKMISDEQPSEERVEARGYHARAGGIVTRRNKTSKLIGARPIWVAD